MQEKFRSKVKAGWKSISIDGSAFDSQQLAQLMEQVDDKFWYSVEQWLRSGLRGMCQNLRNRVNLDQSQIWERLLKSGLQKTTVLFIKIPEINGRPWPQRIQKVWQTDHAKEVRQDVGEELYANWLWVEINGTTFSGHPTKTTLGNTFRSILYAKFYVLTAQKFDLRKEE